MPPVPLKDGKAVIDVEGIPEGDDYFAVFMDSYDGTVSRNTSVVDRLPNANERISLALPTQVFTRSSKFSILASELARP